MSGTSNEFGLPSANVLYDIPRTQVSAFPRRIEICLPQDQNHHLAPIPLSRIFSIEEWALYRDSFDVLKHAVCLLLNSATHLSTSDRERLRIRMDRNPSFSFVHSESRLLLGASQEFGNFAMQCILSEHNSTQPLVLMPLWPSVTFDKEGRPRFPVDEDVFFTGGPPDKIRQKIHHKGSGGRGDANADIPPNMIAFPAKYPPNKADDFIISSQGRRVNFLLPPQETAPTKDYLELPRL